MDKLTPRIGASSPPGYPPHQAPNRRGLIRPKRPRFRTPNSTA